MIAHTHRGDCMRTVSVKVPSNSNVYPFLTVVIHEKRFGNPLPLIVTRADADGIDISPIALRLGVNCWIAVNFACRCLEDARFHPLCQPQHVNRPQYARLCRFDRVVLVVDRAGRTGEVVDPVDLDHKRVGDVVADQFKTGVV